MTRLSIVVATFLTGALHAVAGGNCSSINLPIQWMINSTYIDGATASAILGDGAPYVDGQTGVDAAIQVCSGSNDATLLLNRSRSFSFNSARLLASNVNTPAWALGGITVTGGTALNIRNILFVPAGSTRAQEYTFTTRFATSIPAAKGSWTLRMLNPSSDAVQNGELIANDPYLNSLVVVHHCPANTNTASCPNIVKETWFAYPDTNASEPGLSQTGLPKTSVGTLLDFSKPTAKNAGEFSMPFYFTISLK